MRCKILVRSLMLVVLVLGASHRSAAAIEAVDAQCRYKVSNAARTYLNNLAQRVNTCHQRRMRGQLPAALDCNDPSTWVANGYAAGAARMQVTLERIIKIANACNPIGDTPASVGYTSCPAPCAGLPVGTFTEVAGCMKCVVDSCLLPAAQQIYGTVPLPVGYLARQCQQVMGVKLEEYTTKRLFLQDSCRYNQERGKPAVQGINCLTDLDNPATALSVAHRRALNDFTARVGNRCAQVADIVGELDSCATDSATAVSCVLAVTSSCADTVYQASMP